MNNTLNVPSRIRVGFRERNDTYTKKLAFIIYYDVKGKIRKEKSWEGWRDKSIEPEEYDNVPTDGFVLNRAVGGVRRSYGWNARNEYTRVYDPRGFEFEISVSNLLFILQECSSIKGKGLEGEFVYAWNGTQLILLPVSSSEYQQSVNYTSMQSNKVTSKDMEVGCTYLTKDKKNVMYMGRHICYINISKKYGFVHIAPVKKHVFSLYTYTSPANKNKYSLFNNGYDVRKYLLQTGFTKLAKKTSDGPIPEYADEYDKLIDSCLIDPISGLSAENIELINPLPDSVSSLYICIEEDGRYYVGNVSRYRNCRGDNLIDIRIHGEAVLINNEFRIIECHHLYHNGKIKEEELRRIIKKLYIITDSGKQYRVWGGNHAYEKN